MRFINWPNDLFCDFATIPIICRENHVGNNTSVAFCDGDLLTLTALVELRRTSHSQNGNMPYEVVNYHLVFIWKIGFYALWISARQWIFHNFIPPSLIAISKAILQPFFRRFFHPSPIAILRAILSPVFKKFHQTFTFQMMWFGFPLFPSRFVTVFVSPSSTLWRTVTPSLLYAEKTGRCTKKLSDIYNKFTTWWMKELFLHSLPFSRLF